MNSYQSKYGCQSTSHTSCSTSSARFQDQSDLLRRQWPAVYYKDSNVDVPFVDAELGNFWGGSFYLPNRRSNYIQSCIHQTAFRTWSFSFYLSQGKKTQVDHKTKTCFKSLHVKFQFPPHLIKGPNRVIIVNQFSRTTDIAVEKSVLRRRHAE